MFQFRLQKVLEYRERLEGLAKDAYLDARSSRLATEAGLLELHARRGALLETSSSDLDSRRALETILLSLDDQERAENLVLKVLKDDEEKAMNAWRATKRDVETLVRLRETSLKEHEIEQNRKEQRELDEWAILRRAA